MTAGKGPLPFGRYTRTGMSPAGPGAALSSARSMGAGTPPRAFDIAFITSRARCAVSDSIAGRFASASALSAAWIWGCTCMISRFLQLVLLRAAAIVDPVGVEADDGSVFADAARRIGVEHFRKRTIEHEEAHEEHLAPHHGLGFVGIAGLHHSEEAVVALQDRVQRQEGSAQPADIDVVQAVERLPGAKDELVRRRVHDLVKMPMLVEEGLLVVTIGGDAHPLQRCGQLV